VTPDADRVFPVELEEPWAVYSADIIALLVEHAEVIQGRQLEPFVGVRALEPPEEPLEMGRCLANAILYASDHEDHDIAGWRVVVGYANPRSGRPLAHAWVVDPDGQPWDVTWRDVEDVTYIGVALISNLIPPPRHTEGGQ
jgi:hypothetical protein